MNPPPLNILIAEDERSVAFSIWFVLQADGHKIEVVTEGEQALAKIIGEPGAFDLLITDNNRSGFDWDRTRSATPQYFLQRQDPCLFGEFVSGEPRRL
jgi:CheY-like chemotaxis protein